MECGSSNTLLFLCLADDILQHVDKIVLKSAYSGMVAFILEATKHDKDIDGITYD